MRTHRILLLMTFTACIAVVPLLAQLPSEQKPSFEVASIKEHPFQPGFVGLDFQPGGRLVVMMAPVQMMITAAYELVPAQVQIAPNVDDSSPLKTTYDIEAKTAPGEIPAGRMSRASEQKMRLMLRSLLSDRFKLKMHIEKKELAVYALTVEKNGLKLQAAPDRKCELRPSPCNLWTKARANTGVSGQSVTLQDLADLLTAFVDRNIVDKTGVESMFDVNLPPFMRGVPTRGVNEDGTPVDLTTPSLATVLHEVGLRLEPQKQIMDVYVIDHAEKPTNN